ncbi:o-acyltransferase [Anaeramoeba flamelloides]|uniref:O-acyltransferase n=1 Tax=Anaeramoeba flamelloides TaxID=1746091 RepID=A0ABQ8XQU9_9EUKA|nr:o-acyltransferase [Anaeramoeba flamelloides]
MKTEEGKKQNTQSPQQTVRKSLYVEDLKPLKGLRAVCALFIMVGHFFTYFTPNLIHKEGYGPENKDLEFPGVLFPIEFLQGVTFFFLLSGISFARIYTHTGSLDTRAGKKKFIWKRFVRLSPAYYFGLLLSFAPFYLYYYVQEKDYLRFFGSLLTTPLFLQSVNPQFIAWNSPLWTVSIFMLCYLLYPYISKKLYLAKEKTLKWIAFYNYSIPFLIVIIFMFFIGSYTVLLVCHVSIIRITHFIVGAILGEYIERWRKAKSLEKLDFIQTLTPVSIQKAKNENREVENPQSVNGDQNINNAGNGPNSTKKKPRTKKTISYDLIVDLGSIFLLFTQAVTLYCGYKYGRLHNFVKFFLEFSLVPLHCYWIFAIMNSKKSLTCRFFNLGIFNLLNEVSYNVYCLHFPIFYLYTWLINKEIVPSYTQFMDAVYALKFWHIFIIVPLVWLIGILFHKCIELPFKKKMVKIINKKYSLAKEIQKEVPSDSSISTEDSEDSLDTSRSNSSSKYALHDLVESQ